MKGYRPAISEDEVPALTAAKIPTLDGDKINPDVTLYLDPCFGELVEAVQGGGTGIVCTDVDTYYPWVSAAEGEVQQMTSDVTDVNGDRLIVPVGGAGRYEVTLSGSFGGTASTTFIVAVHEDDIETDIWVERALGAGGDVGAFSITGYLDLADAAELSIEVQNTTGASKTFTPHQMRLTAKRIGAAGA